MTSRLTSFAAGLALTAVGSFAVLSAEHRDHHLKAEACARDGLESAACATMEGDHIWPLCGGGADALLNIQLQPCDRWETSGDGVPNCVAGEAWRKDQAEKHWCAMLRRGQVTQSQLGAFFVNHKRCPPGVGGCW